MNSGLATNNNTFAIEHAVLSLLLRHTICSGRPNHKGCSGGNTVKVEAIWVIPIQNNRSIATKLVQCSANYCNVVQRTAKVGQEVELAVQGGQVSSISVRDFPSETDD
jgi:hypothetical protein